MLAHLYFGEKLCYNLGKTTSERVVTVAKRHNMVQHNLVKNAIAAYFAAVEIHNKPNIPYRYQTVSLLLTNAWELILKAYIKKYDKARSIYTSEDQKKTITLDHALDVVEQHINKKQPKHFTAAQRNLHLLEEYRNCYTHYYSEQIEPLIFMIVAKAAINFASFVKEYFGKDIVADEGLFILPIGFSLPFRVEDFLSRKAKNYPTTPEANSFVNSIIKATTELDEAGISEAVVVGFDLLINQVKKESNGAILATITKDEDGVLFTKRTQVVLSNDPNAQRMAVDESNITTLFPLRYADVCARCRESIPAFKQDRKFNEIMKDLKLNRAFCHERKLDPANPKSTKTHLYAESIILEIQKRYADEAI